MTERTKAQFLEALKEAGLTESDTETVTKVIEALKLSYEPNIEIRYTQMKENRDKLKTDNEKMAKELADLPDLESKAEATSRRIAELEAQVSELTDSHEKAIGERDLRIQLLSNGANPDDIDFLVFKLSSVEAEKYESVLSDLKAKNPYLFREGTTESKKEEPKVEPLKLEQGKAATGAVKPVSQMSYQELQELQQTNPELFASLL